MEKYNPWEDPEFKHYWGGDDYDPYDPFEGESDWDPKEDAE